MNRRKVPRILMTVLLAFLVAIAGWPGPVTAEQEQDLTDEELWLKAEQEQVAGDDDLWLMTDEELAKLEAMPTEAKEEPLLIPEDEPGLPIVTPYLTLYYPTLYAEDVAVEVAENEEGCTISLITTIEETELKLCSMTLTRAAGEGFKLGTLDDLGVYVLMNQQEADQWSEEAFLRINELQESVNALLVQIYECENFVAGQ